MPSLSFLSWVRHFSNMTEVELFSNDLSYMDTGDLVSLDDNLCKALCYLFGAIQFAKGEEHDKISKQIDLIDKRREDVLNEWKNRIISEVEGTDMILKNL